jgi:hypothetical protein
MEEKKEVQGMRVLLMAELPVTFLRISFQCQILLRACQLQSQ